MPLHDRSKSTIAAVGVVLLSACAPPSEADPEAAIAWRTLSVEVAITLYEADGRVGQLLLAGDTALVVLDRGARVPPMFVSRAQPPRSLGRYGGGPGELSGIGAIAMARGDSLAVIPRMPLQPMSLLSLQHGTGRSVSLRSEAPASARAWMSAITFMAADTLGHVYGTRREAMAEDSMPIVRLRMRDHALDTIAWLPTGEPDEVVRSANGYTITGGDQYQRLNGWTATADGRVVFVDVSTYAVTVFGLDGGVVAAWRVPRSELPVNERAWRDAQRGRDAMLQSAAPMVRERAPIPLTLPPPGNGGGPRALPLVALERNARPLLFDGAYMWVPVHTQDPPVGERWERRLLSDGTLTQRLAMPRGHRLLAISAICAVLARSTPDGNEVVVSVPLTASADTSRICGP